MPTLVAMKGLPRSGKSTKARNLSKIIHAPIVNADAIRLAMHGTAYDPDFEDQVKWFRRVMIDALFRTGHNVVIYDETNWSQAARDAIKDEKWDTIFCEVDTDAKLCIERAKTTHQDYLIPVIYDMMARVEPLSKDDAQVTDLYKFIEYLKNESAKSSNN